MGFQLLKGEHLNDDEKSPDNGPFAVPRELIRCYEEHIKGSDGKDSVRKISLMKTSEIAQFRTLFFYRCIELYNTWKVFKQSPPMGQGWGNERAVICEILRLLEVENNQYDAWEREKENERRKVGKHGY